jgi:hypothetical protein
MRASWEARSGFSLRSARNQFCHRGKEGVYQRLPKHRGKADMGGSKSTCDSTHRRMKKGAQVNPTRAASREIAKTGPPTAQVRGGICTSLWHRTAAENINCPAIWLNGTVGTRRDLHTFQRGPYAREQTLNTRLAHSPQQLVLGHGPLTH